MEYSYEVHGLKYRSRQVKLGMQIGGSQSVAETMVKKYPQGSDVTVHYDPENPSDAALERPTGSAWLLLAAAVVCFAIAVYVSAIFR